MKQLERYVFLVSALLMASSVVISSVDAQVNTVSGRVFVDLDGNGVEDGQDVGYAAVRIKIWSDLDMSGDISAGDAVAAVGFTDNNGDYSVDVRHSSNTLILTTQSSTDAGEVNAGSDPSTSSSDFDFGSQAALIRFANVELPGSATITNAFIRFTAADANQESDPTNLMIQAVALADPRTVAGQVVGDIVTRPLFATPNVSWNVPTFDFDMTYDTPDMAALVTAQITQSGWEPVNALAYFIDGTGERDAVSHGAATDPAKHPTLHITYTTPVTPYVIELCTDDVPATATVSLDSGGAFANGSAANVNFGVDTELPAYCYLIADNDGDNNADTLVLANRLTGASRVVGLTGTNDVEGAAISPIDLTFYVADGAILGTIDYDTGAFTAIGPAGSADGVDGTVDITDLDGMAVDPNDGLIWATHRRVGPFDLLVKLDPTTGAVIAGAFGGDDYVVIKDMAETIPVDIDDLAYNPTTGTMYAVANRFGDLGDTLVTIDLTTGEATSVGMLTLPGGGLLNDVEGFAFTQDGQLIGSTGKDSFISGDQVSITFTIDQATAETSDVVYSNSSSDYESLDCYTVAVEFPQPAKIGNFVFRDADKSGDQSAGDTGFAGVTVNLRDGTGTNVLQTATTDASGEYCFEVDAGTFVIEVVRPDGYVFAPQGMGGSSDSDVDSSGMTASITVAAGDIDLDSGDAGLQVFAVMNVPDQVALGDRVDVCLEVCDTNPMLKGIILIGTEGTSQIEVMGQVHTLPLDNWFALRDPMDENHDPSDDDDPRVFHFNGSTTLKDRIGFVLCNPNLVGLKVVAAFVTYDPTNFTGIEVSSSDAFEITNTFGDANQHAAFLCGSMSLDDRLDRHSRRAAATWTCGRWPSAATS